MIYKKTEQQAQIYEITKGTKWDVLLTLTFPWCKNKKSHDDVTPVLNAFFKHVENKCFGRQAINNPIVRFPVLEYSASEGSHIHVLMVKPDDKSHSYFNNVLSSKWKRLTGTGKQNLVSNSGFYQVIGDTQKDRAFVSNYITKAINNKYEPAVFQCMAVA